MNKLSSSPRSLVLCTLLVGGTLAMGGSIDALADDSVAPAGNRAGVGTGRFEQVLQQGGPCAATLSSDLKVLQVPRFSLDDSYYAATFSVVQGSDGGLLANLSSIAPTSRSDCYSSDTGIVIVPETNLALHVPSLILGPARYWLNLELMPATDGTTSLKLTSFGKAATGVTGEGSAYLSWAKTSVTRISATQSRAQVSFHGGTEAQVTLTLLENQTYSPPADEAAEVTRLGIKVVGAKSAHSETSDTLQARIEYFVPVSALASARPGQFSADAPGPMNGTRVVFESVAKSYGKSAVEGLAKKHYRSAGEGLVKGVFAVTDVVSAWDTMNEQQTWMQRLDATQGCVENPDAITAQFYDQNPGEKQKRLDMVAAARTELKLNTGNRFMTTLVAGALDLLEGLLSPVTAGATGYVDEATKYTNESVVTAVENYVGKCAKKAYKADYSFAAQRLYGTICYGKGSFTLSYDGGGFLKGIMGCTGDPLADAGTCAFLVSYGTAPCTYDNEVKYKINRDDQGPASVFLDLPTGNVTCALPAPVGNIVVPVPGFAVTAPLTYDPNARTCN